jgi:serine/threonine protein kinase
LALEIAAQVAAGLAAVHKQKLVHRDIKPSNIMVNLEEGGVVTAKIIDLGLRKTRKPPARLAPKKISVARLPVTGSDVFGREEDIAFLDRAWAKKDVTSLQSLPGLGPESPHSSTIGFEGWQLNTIAPRSSSLAGPFTDRVPVGTLPQQMNFLMPLSLGLATPIRGSEPPGRRANGWQSSSRIVEPCWSWTAWSRFRIRLVHKKTVTRTIPPVALARTRCLQ